MEFVGEVAADFLGLNQSKFQWAIDQKALEDATKARRRKAKAERERAAAASVAAQQVAVSALRDDALEAGASPGAAAPLSV